MKENINTAEYWNSYYEQLGFYQDKTLNDRVLWNELLDYAMCEFVDSVNVKVLHLACGLDYVGDYISKNEIFSVLSTDISRVAVNESISRFAKENLSYSVVDAIDSCILYPKRNVIVAFELIEHYENPAGLLRFVQSSLKNGGLFVFSVPHELGPHAHCDQHYSYWNKESITDALYLAGFKSVEFLNIGPKLHHIFGIARKQK